jgi:hypothetical protein
MSRIVIVILIYHRHKPIDHISVCLYTVWASIIIVKETKNYALQFDSREISEVFHIFVMYFYTSNWIQQCTKWSLL